MTVTVAEHRADLDRLEDVEPLPAGEQLAWAVRLAARYGHVEELADLDPVDPDRCVVATRSAVGVCDDCQRTVPARYRVGRVAVCRSCATSRVRAAKTTRETK